MKKTTYLAILTLCLSFATAFSQVKHQVELNPGLVYFDTDVSPEHYPYFNTQGFGIGVSYGYLISKNLRLGININNATRNLSIFQGSFSYDEKINLFNVSPFLSYNVLSDGSKSEIPIKASLGFASVKRNFYNAADIKINEWYNSVIYGIEIAYYYKINPTFKIGLGISAEATDQLYYKDVPILFQNKLKLAYSF